MIKDRLQNANTYDNLSEGIRIGFEWLKNNDLENISDGKYEINKDVYVNVQTYETKADADYESHKKYIDIQYMINGAEKIGVTNVETCSVKTVYDEDKDIEFSTSYDGEYISLNKGEFLILFPQDAHKPSINMDKKLSVKKAVVKVKIK